MNEPPTFFLLRPSASTFGTKLSWNEMFWIISAQDFLRRTFHCIFWRGVSQWYSIRTKKYWECWKQVSAGTQEVSMTFFHSFENFKSLIELIWKFRGLVSRAITHKRHLLITNETECWETREEKLCNWREAASWAKMKVQGKIGYRMFTVVAARCEVWSCTNNNTVKNWSLIKHLV